VTDGEAQSENTQPYSDQDFSQPEAEAFDAYRSVVRLLVGLALIGGDSLIGRLREWEGAYRAGEPAAADDGDSAVRALVGLTFDTAEMIRQVVLGAAGLSATVAGTVWSAVRPVTHSWLFRPFWLPVRNMAARGEANRERCARIGRSEELRSRKLAGEVTESLIEAIISYVGDNPGVKALVDAQVAGLAAHPEKLDSLVRAAGDRYIAYLNEHPENVQNLVQGQAVGMATEVRDDVRTLTVTGDTLLETITRALFRRPPREDLPPPPPEVRQRLAPGQLVDDVRYLKEVGQ
jgi:hypothetical protein